jgi:hypothetical protein
MAEVHEVPEVWVFALDHPRLPREIARQDAEELLENADALPPVGVRPNVLGFTCATNMPPAGREVQAEWPGTLPAYRVRCKPVLYSILPEDRPAKLSGHRT